MRSFLSNAVSPTDERCTRKELKRFTALSIPGSGLSTIDVRSVGGCEHQGETAKDSSSKTASVQLTALQRNFQEMQLILQE